MTQSIDARGFDDRDRIYAVLRVVALVATVSYALVSLPAGEMRVHVLLASGGFVAYSAVAYMLGWPLVRLYDKTRFYQSVAGLDLAFCVLLLVLTGGATSPFYRALYVWIAMFAFYFGRVAGLRASLAALAIFLGLYLYDGVLPDPWVFMVQAGGMVMHGPLIGALADRERKRSTDLRLARDRLDEANRRLLEEKSQRIQVEKLSSLGLLAAGVAHEINNPLSGVLGCVKALRDGQVAPERREQYFDTVRDGLDRIGQTVRGLLDYARQSPVQSVRVEVREVMEASVRLVHPALHKKRIECDLEVEQDRFHVYADRSQLMQVLVNLLLNAVEASEPDTRLTLGCAAAPGGFVVLTVRDRGTGIPEEILGRICDPFFTTKAEGLGTGLGLSVSLGIVRNHGGDLEFEPAPGGGTLVKLRLPEVTDARSAAGR
ncbi:MAG: sensor histidine kinase [Bradymonadia bacterium]|jgi:signal transduction histidine kinase